MLRPPTAAEMAAARFGSACHSFALTEEQAAACMQLAQQLGYGIVWTSAVADDVAERYTKYAVDLQLLSGVLLQVLQQSIVANQRIQMLQAQVQHLG